MEVLEIIDTILRQYRGTNAEKMILAILMIIQENANIQKRIGERINPNGTGFALDLLGAWIGLPRPIIRDLFADYWGFEYDPKDPANPRNSFNRAPFFSDIGDQYFRAHAGDSIYREALKVKARQIFGLCSLEKMAGQPPGGETSLRINEQRQRGSWQDFAGIALYVESTSMEKDTGGPVSSDQFGDSTWHNGDFLTTSPKDVNGDQKIVGFRKRAKGGLLIREGFVTDRRNLPAGTVGLSSLNGVLYAITENAVSGDRIFSINTETLEFTGVSQSNPSGLPSIVGGCVISGDKFLAISGTNIYTCSYGDSSAILNTDAMPSGTNLTSIENSPDGVLAIDENSRKIYKRDSDTRQWEKASDKTAYPLSRTETPYLAVSNSITFVSTGNYVSAGATKLYLNHKRACGILLSASEFGKRSLIDSIQANLIPRNAGVSVTYDFYYPLTGVVS